jgi:AraC family transcriptional regulator
MPEKGRDSMQPRLVDGGAMLIAGLRERYECLNMSGIPGQWQRFEPRIGTIRGKIGRAAFGVISAGGGNGIDYLTGVMVSDLAELPADFSHIELPPRRYAVFPHRGHVSTLRQTIHAIWNLLPQSGHEAATDCFFERYGEGFDPRTGTGDIEVWVPVRS